MADNAQDPPPADAEQPEANANATDTTENVADATGDATAAIENATDTVGNEADSTGGTQPVDENTEDARTDPTQAGEVLTEEQQQEAKERKIREEAEKERAEAESNMPVIGESIDDPEQKSRFEEYLALLKSIKQQNLLIDDIKELIIELSDKQCRTKSENMDLKRLRCCLETEVSKLRCLMNKAIQLQNFGSHRQYPDIMISTSLNEDNLTSGLLSQRQNWQGAATSANSVDDSDYSEQVEPSSCQEQSSQESDKDQNLKCLFQAMAKMKMACPEDKKVLQDIAMSLLSNSRNQKKDKQEPCIRKKQDPCNVEFSSQRRGASRGSNRTLTQIKEKISCMQESVDKLKREICKRQNNKADGRKLKDREMKALNECQCQPPQPSSYEESDRDEFEDEDAELICTKDRETKAKQLEQLKESYLCLLSEYSKKDSTIQELEKRIKSACDKSGHGGKNAKKTVEKFVGPVGGEVSCRRTTGDGAIGNEATNIGSVASPERSAADETELKLLRNRCKEMKEEQEEFRCLMKEQSQQLEDYRKKYLSAQQKVEEQCVTIEKLNMNNKRIEKQINTEVKEIRSKFQEKLNELCHFPKLLENEQIKLAKVCEEKEEMACQLGLVCKELKTLKAKQETPKEQDDCRPQLLKCQQELVCLQSKLDEAQRQRDLFCDQLQTTKCDLDTLRTESAGIIARSKERAQATRQQMQNQIDNLEKELAQCRATSCISVSDREAIIREMQGQLNTLSYSFDAAQKQIKTLRNHVAYVSNERTYAVRC